MQLKLWKNSSSFKTSVRSNLNYYVTSSPLGILELNIDMLYSVLEIVIEFFLFCVSNIQYQIFVNIFHWHVVLKMQYLYISTRWEQMVACYIIWLDFKPWKAPYQLINTVEITNNLSRPNVSQLPSHPQCKCVNMSVGWRTRHCRRTLL